MPPTHQRHWERQLGDGLIHDGPCLVHTLIITPGGQNEYHDIYDGRDTTSGTLFCRFSTTGAYTHHIDLGPGVLFGKGIYIDVQNPTDAVTAVFTLV